AQELRTPISLHSITGIGWESQCSFRDRYVRATVLSHEIERSFSVLIFSGVLDRFPDLQIVSAENNCGWLPYYLQRMDRTFERGRFAAGFKLTLKPSEYFHRQMHCTYIDDYVGVANRHFIGVDKLMWSSDYPHQASSWPHSQDVGAHGRRAHRRVLDVDRVQMEVAVVEVREQRDARQHGQYRHQDSAAHPLDHAGASQDSHHAEGDRDHRQRLVLKHERVREDVDEAARARGPRLRIGRRDQVEAEEDP